MSLSPGTRLGPYEIVSPLGAGGMGEVYRARDTRLERSVAVKVLPADMAGDDDRRARFEREAKAIAALTHPNICTLYDVGHAPTSGTSGPVEFLVMELLEGESLADRLSRGPLPLSEALTLAAQVASALDRAHREGIVHRDLKPGNIMLTRSGAKLLDFGLARLRAEQGPFVDTPTQTRPLTAAGLIVGTLQYMAPEQLEGRAVDHRADLFSFGAVLYEMVSGRRAFEATSTAGLISAILQGEPPRLSTVAPVSPPSLDRIVSRCLVKDPEARWSSAHDVRMLLEEVAAGPTPDVALAAPQPHRWREWVAWGAAAVALVAAAVALGTRGNPSPQTIVPDVLSIMPPAGAALTQGEAPQISPDGRTVVFVATDEAGRTRLHVRRRDSADTRVLPETDDATLPFWSPDSRSVGFFAGGRLKRIDLDGGAPLTLSNAPVPRGGAWSRDNLILFVPFPSQPPLLIPASGGEARPIPFPEASTGGVAGRWFPFFLPDGRHYLYLGRAQNNLGGAIKVGSIDSAESKELVPSRATASYVHPGYLVFRREEALVAQRFDPDRLELSGDPMSIADRVGFNPITYQALFSASADGVLTYLGAEYGWQLLWLDRLGRRLGVAAPPGGYNSLCLSPDGKRVVYDLADSRTGAVDIWTLDLVDGTTSRLTFDPAVDFYVACSPTTPDVVFASLRQGPPQIYRGTPAAPGGESLLANTGMPSIPTDWSRDGRFIIFSALSPKTSFDIWALPIAEGKAFPVSPTEAEERNAKLSPDGRWLAYCSNQGGAHDVYVQPFPPTGPRWQISRGGGQQPVWAPDGRQLFFISPDKKLMAVDVRASGQTFEAGTQRVLTDTRVGSWERSNQGAPFAVTPDGERFLVNNATERVLPITVVLNWTAALRDRP